MDYREATDRARRLGFKQEEIATALGVSRASMKAARLEESSTNYRRPPGGWERAISELARKRAKELEKLAGDLESLHADER